MLRRNVQDSPSRPSTNTICRSSRHVRLLRYVAIRSHALDAPRPSWQAAKVGLIRAPLAAKIFSAAPEGTAPACTHSRLIVQSSIPVFRSASSFDIASCPPNDSSYCRGWSEPIAGVRHDVQAALPERAQIAFRCEGRGQEGKVSEMSEPGRPAGASRSFGYLDSGRVGRCTLRSLGSASRRRTTHGASGARQDLSALPYPTFGGVPVMSQLPDVSAAFLPR